MKKKIETSNFHASKKDKEKKDNYDPAKLSIDEALDLLSIHIEKRKGKNVQRVHSLEGFAFGVMGCDMDLSSVKKHLKDSTHIALAGPNMRGMGHGVGFFEEGRGYTFLETDKEKLDEIYKKRKIK